MSTKAVASVATPDILARAALDAVRKLDPRLLAKNPVIFVTEAVAALVTVLFIRDLATGQPVLFTGQIMAWLWFTVLFANFRRGGGRGAGPGAGRKPEARPHRHAGPPARRHPQP